MRDQVVQEYQRRSETYLAQFKKADALSQKFSYGRLAVFIVGALLTYFVLVTHFVAGIVVAVVTVVAFLYIIKRHAVLEEEKNHFRYLAEVNQHELKAQEGDFAGLKEGKEFVDTRHGYTYDLDIFGARSIFQYINRTATHVGYHLLAGWLKKGFKEKSEIERRQEAIKDLSQRLDFRQNFLALGLENLENEDGSESLKSWLKEPFYYQPHKWYKYIIIVLPVLTILMLILSMVVEQITWPFPVVLILLNFYIIRQNLPRVNPTHAKLSKRSNVLTKYAGLLAQVENENFTSPFLQELQTQLARKGASASESIQQLGSISKAFDNRLNAIAALFLNGTILWDLQIMFRLEKWKQDARDEVEIWFEVLAEMDGLISLGGFAYNHPEFNYPTVNEDEYILKGNQMGHILLHPNVRVDNTLNLEGDGHYIIITGANMAGKSTFLRTVGVNLILAMTGVPVCAKSFEFHPIELATSVRATDSLQDNESYFYAELLRLKSIVDRLRKGDRLFVIIDEMLRGTNSRDKQIGSRGFIEQLVTMQGMGMIATHDLSLGTLQDEYPEKVRNMRFEIEITDDQLHFDYTLRPGISQNLNATFLMKKMGIMKP